MKMYYYPETDSLYIELLPRPGSDVREIAPGFVVDLDEEGRVLGFDIDQASKHLDLSELKTKGIPVTEPA